MQNGGCHPVDGCYFPAEPYAGADFQWLAANVVNESTGETPLPPYWIERFNNVKVGFIGMTLEATDTLVAAAGIQGWDFLDEAETANALVPILKAQGVEAIVVLLHEGGSQTPPPGDVDACVGISGPIVAINDALDPGDRRDDHRPHPPAVQLPAAGLGRPTPHRHQCLLVRSGGLGGEPRPRQADQGRPPRPEHGHQPHRRSRPT